VALNEMKSSLEKAPSRQHRYAPHVMNFVAFC
jgi:hypothetical protein